MSSIKKQEAPKPIEKNELEKVFEQGGSFLQKNATAVVAVICALLLMAAVWTWISRSSQATNSEPWTQLYSAKDVTDFEHVAEKYSGTNAGRWAALREAEVNLRKGLDEMFTDRELGKIDLGRAQKKFKELVANFGNEPLIRDRAGWGLAQCLEALCDGDTAPAIAAYEQLRKDVPESMYKPLIEERIANLKLPATKEFYAWFSKQNPKTEDVRPKDALPKDFSKDGLPAPSKADESDDKDSKTSEEAKKEGGDKTSSETEKSKTDEPAKDAKDQPDANSKEDTKQERGSPDKPADSKPEPGKTESGKTEPTKSESAKPEDAKPEEKSSENKSESKP